MRADIQWIAEQAAWSAASPSQDRADQSAQSLCGGHVLVLRAETCTTWWSVATNSSPGSVQMCEAQWNNVGSEEVYHSAVHRTPLMETHMFKKIFVASTLAFTALSALAAPAASEAQTHFQAIAVGDVAAVMHGYADAAHFVWVGGPLDGTYTGVDAIRPVWEKFIKSQGTMKVAVDKVEESSNPKGSSVTANVTFQGKQPIKVRYVLTYRDNKIVSETWQIDPKLGSATY